MHSNSGIHIVWRHAQRLNEMHNVSEEIAGLYQLSPTRVNEKTDPQGSVLSFRVGTSGRTRTEHEVRGGVVERSGTSSPTPADILFFASLPALCPA